MDSMAARASARPYPKVLSWPSSPRSMAVSLIISGDLFDNLLLGHVGIDLPLGLHYQGGDAGDVGRGGRGAVEPAPIDTRQRYAEAADAGYRDAVDAHDVGLVS